MIAEETVINRQVLTEGPDLIGGNPNNLQREK